MVGLDGEKMSKSKGNLVLVSTLRAAGVDPMAIRLVLLAQHYRAEWSWTHDLLDQATERLDTWRAALSVNAGPPAEDILAAIRDRVAADLDTAGALTAVDRWARDCLSRGGSDAAAPGVLARALDSILGIRV
jgi:L-cysteine:1D-myo-inositol 2-amino-2-deoxy-alpha-D-glucopyranoside ligase